MNDLRVYAPDECGGDGYPFAWHAEIKHHVRELAGHRCVRCGHPYAKGAGEWSPCDKRCIHQGPFRWREDENEWCEHPDGSEPWVPTVAEVFDGAIEPQVEARWRILTVHHFDGDKANCRWWNLAALCQRCHLTIQGRVVLARVYVLNHSDWFKPYAAGYYAHAYLGADLTRDETLARLDELLALEAAC